MMNKINTFFSNFLKQIDKKIIIPATKNTMAIYEKYSGSGKQFENWLSKANTLLFISLFLSFFVFVIVDQKIVTFTESSAEVFKDQKVIAIFNEEAYVVEGLPKVVDVTLIGNRADLYFAKQSPVSDITVDLSGLKPGTHRVSIKYNQALPTIDYKVNPSVATVIIYPKLSETKTVAVDVLNKDKLDSKLIITNIAVENDKVVIKGAEHQLSKVASVKALVDINNLVKQETGTTVIRDVPLRAYDQSGNVINIEIVPAKIDVTLEIVSPSKDVPIRIIPVGNVSFGKAISSITSNVTSVTIYGEEAALASINAIPVEVNVEGIKTNQQYRLELIGPSGVKHMTVTNITVGVTLGDSIDIELEGINIEYRNLDENIFGVNGVNREDLEITVILKGVEDVIKQITASDITAYVDLKGFGQGQHDVDVFVEGTDLKVQYLPKTLKVKLIITRR
jgi:YbbR domain-containing protein